MDGPVAERGVGTEPSELPVDAPLVAPYVWWTGDNFALAGIRCPDFTSDGYAALDERGLGGRWVVDLCGQPSTVALTSTDGKTWVAVDIDLPEPTAGWYVVTASVGDRVVLLEADDAFSQPARADGVVIDLSDGASTRLDLADAQSGRTVYSVCLSAAGDVIVTFGAADSTADPLDPLHLTASLADTRDVPPVAVPGVDNLAGCGQGGVTVARSVEARFLALGSDKAGSAPVVSELPPPPVTSFELAGAGTGTLLLVEVIVDKEAPDALRTNRRVWELADGGWRLGGTTNGAIEDSFILPIGTEVATLDLSGGSQVVRVDE